MRTILVACFVSLVAATPVAAQVTAPVKIDTGRVTGVVRDGFEAFLGIPYAAPPVGKLRWRAPQPAASWSGVRAADRKGMMCPQAPRPAGFGPEVRAEDMSEDCLFLNVYRPSSSTGPLPVMVWIHGGALTAGSSTVPTYDGDAFARGGVVLVSINYRLGRLGIFAHPALTAENADGGRFGNYALMDQIAALQWVKRNIAAFGGDPGNVTIFGESAGALSVDGLMISPLARGLFHRAVAQSGYGRGYAARLKDTAPNGRRSAEADGVEFAERLGLTSASLSGLRAVPADKIVAAVSSDVLFDFILDGKVIADDMWAAFRADKAAPVPFLLGSNSQETPTAENLDRKPIRALVSVDEEATLAQGYGGRAVMLQHILGDITFTQQTRALARLHSKNGHPTFLYMFGVTTPQQIAEGKGAPHAAELRYVFNTLGAGLVPITGAADKAVADTMNAHWRAFAAAGEPNGPGLAPWPRYDGQKVMVFSHGGAQLIDDPRNPRLDALSAVIDPKS